VADKPNVCVEATAKDWAGDARAFLIVWGLPIGAIIAAFVVSPVPRAVIWTVALLWMGGACLANARRCGRTHCLFTGPFLIAMAATVVAYATGMLALGASGWNIIGATTLLGSAALWWGSERLLGAYRRKTLTAP
jgi:hypothetical protein